MFDFIIKTNVRLLLLLLFLSMRSKRVTFRFPQAHQLDFRAIDLTLILHIFEVGEWILSVPDIIALILHQLQTILLQVQMDGTTYLLELTINNHTFYTNSLIFERLSSWAKLDRRLIVDIS